jgi:hypothetical protein
MGTFPFPYAVEVQALITMFVLIPGMGFILFMAYDKVRQTIAPTDKEKQALRGAPPLPPLARRARGCVRVLSWPRVQTSTRSSGAARTHSSPTFSCTLRPRLPRTARTARTTMALASPPSARSLAR